MDIYFLSLANLEVIGILTVHGGGLFLLRRELQLELRGVLLDIQFQEFLIHMERFSTLGRHGPSQLLIGESLHGLLMTQLRIKEAMEETAENLGFGD
jgi:hypothetical protein